MMDIARMAGVDVSTVSRALADSSRVTEDTKERIRKIVAETGYVVNHAARTLRVQSTGLILVMLPNIASSSFSEIVLGIEEYVQDKGFNVIIGNTQYSARREEELGRQLLNGMVDGLILLTGRIPAVVREMDGFERRIVAVSRSIPDDGIASVSIDNFVAGRDIAAHVLLQGHRRVVHFAGPLESPVFSARSESFRQLMAENGLEPEVIQAPSYDMQGGLAAMETLVARAGDLPTAVVCASDEIALGAIQGARAAGLSVPRQLSFTGFDDISVAQAFDPALTTIRIPRRELGRMGAQMLLANIGGRKGRLSGKTLGHELVVRKSVCPLS